MHPIDMHLLLGAFISIFLVRKNLFSCVCQVGTYMLVGYLIMNLLDTNGVCYFIFIFLIFNF
jgi:hypothetical protein